jgi:hypothetical protein
LLRRGFIFVQAFLLQEGKGHHGEQGMVMEAAPRAAFEVIEPELFFELSVPRTPRIRFANPHPGAKSAPADS